MRQMIDDNRLPLGVVAGLIAIGLGLRLSVAFQDLFADELATWWVVSAHDFTGVIDTVHSDAEITPPLSFALAWLATRIDLTPEMLRLPALIAGTATIPLVWALGERTAGRNAGLLAAALTALSPFMIFYSAEARGYAVMMFCVALSTLLLLLAVERGGRGWWAGYAVAVCLTAYTHYTSIFVLAAQLAWVLWAHPPARRAALLATGAAALLYIPWLSGLKADLESPTTDILGALSPFDPEAIRLSLGHWALGYPYSRVAGLREIPGSAARVALAAAIASAAAALIANRGRIGERPAPDSRLLVLIAALAAATPVGEAVASLVSTNVFSTRNLAASWPYLALTGAAIAMSGRAWQRAAVAALALVAFGLGALKMTSADYARPDYSAVAAYVAAGPGGVVVDGASFTPGPLANFDVAGSDPGGAVLRLNNPEQRRDPFDLADRLTPPEELAERAVAVAGRAPITVVTAVTRNPIAGARQGSPLADRFIAALPPAWALDETRRFDGFLDLEARVFRRR